MYVGTPLVKHDSVLRSRVLVELAREIDSARYPPGDFEVNVQESVRESVEELRKTRAEYDWRRSFPLGYRDDGQMSYRLERIAVKTSQLVWDHTNEVRTQLPTLPPPYPTLRAPISPMSRTRLYYPFCHTSIAPFLGTSPHAVPFIPPPPLALPCFLYLSGRF